MLTVLIVIVVNNDVVFICNLIYATCRGLRYTLCMVIFVDYDAHIIPQYACVIDQIKLNYNGTLFLVMKQMFFKGVVYVNECCP